MDNVIPIDLRSRLVRMGFAEADVDAVLLQLGTDATAEKACHLLTLHVMRSTFQRAGFVNTEGKTWEWQP